MLSIVLIMLGILVVAGGVVAYAAFPHRGERLPGVPWLGDAMSRAVQALPTVEAEEQEQGEVDELRLHR